MNDDTVETLLRQAERMGDEVVFSSGAVGSDAHRSLTFAGLADGVANVAAHLQQAGVGRGDRVAVMMGTGLDYPMAVYGAMAGGAIAVPLFAPGAAKHRNRVEAILLDTRPAAVITSARHLSAVTDAVDALNLKRTVVLDTATMADDHRAEEWKRTAADEIAFLQFTSGSTGQPKGVMVGHDNIAANSASIGRAFGHHERARASGVCWLPLYHDMGIVGSVFHTVAVGARCHLMDPSEFLVSPGRWLQTIAALGADTAGGPNFGFDWCRRHVTDEQLDGIDLSGWSVAYNGSEPIHADTLDRFARRFADYGFDRSAFLPCYGLAEFTLFVTGASLGAVEMTHTVDPAELVEGRVRPARGPGRTLVASGTSGVDTEVLVVDAAGKPLPDGELGEILVAGPSMARGYWRNQAASHTTFGTGPTPPADGAPAGFLRTGDLGFVRHGHLFVAGRRSEMIVVRGRNLFPHDLEAAALDAIDDATGLSCAAVAVAFPDGEDLVVVCETPRGHDDPAAVARDVRLAVAGNCGVQPRLVAMVGRRTLPKTSSGKLRRLEIGRQVERDGLTTLAVDRVERSSSELRPRPELSCPYRAPTDPVEELTVGVWSDVLGIEGLGLDDHFLELGGDSLNAAHIATRLGAVFGLDLDLSDVFEAFTPAEVASLIRAAQATDGDTEVGDDVVELIL